MDSAIMATVPSNEDSMVLAVPEPAVAAVSNLKILYQLSAQLGSAFDEDQVLEVVMDLIFEHVKADRGLVLMLDGQREHLQGTRPTLARRATSNDCRKRSATSPAVSPSTPPTSPPWWTGWSMRASPNADSASLRASWNERCPVCRRWTVGDRVIRAVIWGAGENRGTDCLQELAFSTVTARRFCDQHEMSLHTATGRSLP